MLLLGVLFLQKPVVILSPEMWEAFKNATRYVREGTLSLCPSLHVPSQSYPKDSNKTFSVYKDGCLNL